MSTYNMIDERGNTFRKDVCYDELLEIFEADTPRILLEMIDFRGWRLETTEAMELAL